MDITSENIRKAADVAQEFCQSLIDKLTKNLEIPVIKNCNSISPVGFVINFGFNDMSDDVKNLITDRAICVCCIKKVTEEDCQSDVDSLEQYIGKNKIFDVYIRIDDTNTWLHFGGEMPIYSLIFKKIEEGYDDYDDDDGCDDGEEEDLQHNHDYYVKLNRFATIVAKSKGFNLLKNREQRGMFAENVFKARGEDIDGDCSFYWIGAQAETIYDLGVLPTESQKLKAEGKTEKEIAKILGHTKAKIEKALLCEVTGVIKECLDEYDRNHTTDD